MPTVHVWPFNLTADDSWRGSKTRTSNDACDSVCFVRAILSEEGNPNVDWIDDSIDIRESMFDADDSLTARFNSDPKVASQFVRSCPRPNALIPGDKVRSVRRYDPRTHSWVTTVTNDKPPRLKVNPGSRIKNLRPNPYRSQRSRVTPVPNFIISFQRDPSFGGTQEWSYQGNWAKALHGPMAYRFQNAITEPLATLCQPAALWTDWADMRSSIDDRIVTKVYKKLLNQKVDLATAMAEGAQASKMIADLATRLVKFLVAVKNLNLNKSMRQLQPILNDLLPLTRKKLANDFLAYRYGISPLIGDIQGSADALVEYFDALPRTVVKSRGSDFDESEETWTSSGFNMRLYKSTFVEVAYKVTYAIPSVPIRLIEELGFTNPANVIWELVPFSFVADWFLPIGNYLKYVSSANNLTLHTCERSTFIFQYRQLDCTVPEGVYDDNFVTNRDRTISYSLIERVQVRELDTLPLLPIPQFKNPLSTGHIANAIALFQQLYK